MSDQSPQYDRAVWEEILERGSVNIPASRGCHVDIRRGLPSLTLLRYPATFSMRAVEYLREWGWLLPYRLTVYVPPALRRGQNAPSVQSIASYVQSAILHAERAYRGEETTCPV